MLVLEPVRPFVHIRSHPSFLSREPLRSVTEHTTNLPQGPGQCKHDHTPFSAPQSLTITGSDFADRHPHTAVLGTDIHPTQPSWVPPNLCFSLSDLTRASCSSSTDDGWSHHDDNTFDYIHMRRLAGAVPDWPSLLRQAYRCCAPGGWVESCEVERGYRSDDGTVVAGSALEQFGRVLGEAGRRTGRGFEEGGVVVDAVRGAGFGEVVVWEFKVGDLGLPIGSCLVC